jgi:hypothetical protein
MQSRSTTIKTLFETKKEFDIGFRFFSDKKVVVPNLGKIIDKQLYREKPSK